MKLFLLGSCSRVTSAIIRQAANSGKYSSIVLADLFPNYQANARFSEIKYGLSQKCKIQSIFLNEVQDIERGLKQTQQFISVAHDYFKLVTSKHKLINIAVNLCQSNKHLQQAFVLPIQYQHSLTQPPQANFKHLYGFIQQKLPEASVILSDVTHQGELIATIQKKKKNFVQVYFAEKAIANFRPKCVNVQQLAKQALQFKRGGTIMVGKQSRQLKIGQIINEQVYGQVSDYVKVIHKYKSVQA